MRSHADPLRPDHVSVGASPFYRRQSFWRVALPVAAAFAVIAAILVILQVTQGTNGTPNAVTGWGVTYAKPKAPKTVKFDPRAQVIATKFVRTAVARKNLAAAYAISGPGIREGMTLKQFMTGNIPVVPYTVTPKTQAHMKIDKSYANKATVELYLVTAPDPGKDFYVDLIKKDGKWMVDSWMPRGTPPIPVNTG
jgi:hypothetical protein